MYSEKFKEWNVFEKAISLYEKMGFVRIERYNINYAADIFMVLKLAY